MLACDVISYIFATKWPKRFLNQLPKQLLDTRYTWGYTLEIDHEPLNLEEKFDFSEPVTNLDSTSDGPVAEPEIAWSYKASQGAMVHPLSFNWSKKPQNSMILPFYHITIAYISHNIFSYYTTSTAQGGGGSFKNRKPIGEVSCWDAWMAEQTH